MGDIPRNKSRGNTSGIHLNHICSNRLIMALVLYLVRQVDCIELNNLDKSERFKKIQYTPVV